MENVSVIVPVYNAEKYLRACVESILAQTYKNISVILVDDGSTDSSGKICDEYAERHDNVRVIHKKNGGSVSARITGIEEACKMGGFTTFCDADDLMAPDAAEKLVSLAEENGADIACASLTKFFGKHFHVYLGKTPESKVRVYERDEILKEILPAYYGVCNFPGSMNTKLYSNEILKKSLNFECPVNFFQDDVTFNMQAMPLARRVAVTTDITYYYRVGGGTSRFMPEYLGDALNLYRFKLSRIDSDGLDRQASAHS